MLHLLPVPVILSFLILVVPSRIRYYYVLCLVSIMALLTSIPALTLLLQSGQGIHQIFYDVLDGSVDLTIDGISAFFLVLINIAMIPGMIYMHGYLKSYTLTKSKSQLSLHYFSYLWLYFSMLGVVMLRDGIPFLVAWELMAVTSFQLVLFEAEKRNTLKTAVNYLVQMHIGMVLLLVAFLLCEADTGRMNFDALGQYFSDHSNAGLFFLFFTGFAMKAGFMPFHTWLPAAHPAAPSHISGFMSGIMIKMGIYGILRVLTQVRSDFILIGTVLLAVSAITGFSAILMALVNRDLKKMLAYSSIENIGIIGIGIGIGTLGLGLQQNWLILLGFAGALLHVFHHSLFKPLLFFTTGGVFQQYHTRDMESLGGVIHTMPRTSLAFLTGAVAISGLPPLNGFISEILIFLGLIHGLSAGSVYISVLMILMIITLSLISGLSIFSFTRAFGITFLGTPRKPPPDSVKESGLSLLVPQYFYISLILFSGLFPLLFLFPVATVILDMFPVEFSAEFFATGSLMARLSIFNAILLLLVTVLFLLRMVFIGKHPPSYGPTWGCGYTAGSPRQQYTGTSFSGNLADLAQPLLQTREETESFSAGDIFPENRTFRAEPFDRIRDTTDRTTGLLMTLLKKIARLQTGNIQHYILYAFLFILGVFLLMYLNII